MFKKLSEKLFKFLNIDNLSPKQNEVVEVEEEQIIIWNNFPCAILEKLNEQLYVVHYKNKNILLYKTADSRRRPYFELKESWFDARGFTGQRWSYKNPWYVTYNEDGTEEGGVYPINNSIQIYEDKYK